MGDHTLRSTLKHLGSTQSRIPRTDIMRPGSVRLVDDLLTSCCCTKAPDTGCRTFGSECEIEKGCVMTAHKMAGLERLCKEGQEFYNSCTAAGSPDPAQVGKHLQALGLV